MENEEKYRENVKHDHLTQQPNYENIKYKFKNIQGIQWYQFTLFLLCDERIVDNKNCDMDRGTKLLLGEHQPSLLHSMLKLVDIGEKFRNVQ